MRGGANPCRKSRLPLAAAATPGACSLQSPALFTFEYYSRSLASGLLGTQGRLQGAGHALRSAGKPGRPADVAGDCRNGAGACASPGGRSALQAAAGRRRPPLRSAPSRSREQRAGHKQPNPERLLSVQSLHHLCTAGRTGTAVKALPHSAWTWQTLPVVKGHSSTVSTSCPPLHPAARARTRASRQP